MSFLCASLITEPVAHRLLFSATMKWKSLPKVKLHEDTGLVVYRRNPVSWDDNRALLACVAFTGDVLIVASAHDDVVPAPVSESYTAAFTHARSLISHVIAGADHGLSDERWRREYTTRAWWTGLPKS